MGLARLCSDNLLPLVALAYVAGAGAAGRLHLDNGFPPPALLIPLLLVPVGLAYALGARRAPLATLPFFFFIGLIHTQTALQPINDTDHLAALLKEKSRVTLIGRICSMVEDDGAQSRFVLDASQILFHEHQHQTKFLPVHGRVRLTVAGAVDPQLRPGRLVMIWTTLDLIRNYQTPGAIDFQLLMASRSIRLSGWVQSDRYIQPILEPPPSPALRLRYMPEQLRQRLARFLEQRFDRETAGFYQALLIGSTVNISPERMEQFKANGCFHVLSISGLHMSLLGLFCVLLLNPLLKRSTWLLLHTHVPTLSLALTAPVLIFYTWIAGLAIPVVRSLLAALLVLFAVLVRRQRSFMPLLSAAVLCVLTFCPLALFTPSFQLSFGAVLAISLIIPRLPLPNAADPAVPCLRRIHQAGLRAVCSMLMVSLAATLGTLPIMLYHFNRFSLIGPVMNLVIEPLLCLWALPIGLVAIPLTGLWPDAAQSILAVGALGIRATAWLSDLTAEIPWASVWTITPNGFEIGLYCLIITLLLIPVPGRRYPAILGLSALLAFSLASPLLPEQSAQLQVDFLDVGQGSATLVRLPDGATLLIDAGGYQSPRFDPGMNLVGPFLWKKRLWRVDDLVISHPHKDHFNGMPFVLSHFHPQRLIINGDQEADPGYDRLLDAARRRGIPILVPEAGTLLHQGHELSLRCLGMNGLLDHGHAWSTNEQSLVLHLQYGSRSFLFPGDIGTRSEQRLLTSGFPLAAEVLLAPHHGSATSSSRQFLTAVAPKVIVVSSGQSNMDGRHTAPGIRDWQGRKGAVLWTARQGTITCRTDGRSLTVATFRATEKRFSEKKERNLGDKIDLNEER